MAELTRFLHFSRSKAVCYSLTHIAQLTDVFVAKLCEADRTGTYVRSSVSDVPPGDLLSDLATDVVTGSCVVGHETDVRLSEGEKEKGSKDPSICLRDSSVALQPLAMGPGFFQHLLSAKRKLKHCMRYNNTH